MRDPPQRAQPAEASVFRSARQSNRAAGADGDLATWATPPIGKSEPLARPAMRGVRTTTDDARHVLSASQLRLSRKSRGYARAALLLPSLNTQFIHGRPPAKLFALLDPCTFGPSIRLA